MKQPHTDPRDPANGPQRYVPGTLKASLRQVGWILPEDAPSSFLTLSQAIEWDWQEERLATLEPCYVVERVLAQVVDDTC